MCAQHSCYHATSCGWLLRVIRCAAQTRPRHVLSWGQPARPCYAAHHTQLTTVIDRACEVPPLSAGVYSTVQSMLAHVPIVQAKGHEGPRPQPRPWRAEPLYTCANPQSCLRPCHPFHPLTDNAIEGHFLSQVQLCCVPVTATAQLNRLRPLSTADCPALHRFGFSDRETVAISGAHNLGRARIFFSGQWVTDNDRLSGCK